MGWQGQSRMPRGRHDLWATACTPRRAPEGRRDLRCLGYLGDERAVHSKLSRPGRRPWGTGPMATEPAELSVAGSSARAAYERRLACHREDVRRRRPVVLSFALALAVVGVLNLTSAAVIAWAFVVAALILLISLIIARRPTRSKPTAGTALRSSASIGQACPGSGPRWLASGSGRAKIS